MAVNIQSVGVIGAGQMGNGIAHVCDVVRGAYSPEQLLRYKYEDAKGKFKAEQLTAPHFSETRTINWRGTHPGGNRQWRYSEQELERPL